MLNTVKLKKQEDKRLLAGHLWVYSNEIDTQANPLKDFQPGELVRVISHSGKNLGVAYINPMTLLCTRMLTNNANQSIDEDFFITQIKQSLQLRTLCFSKPYYRIIFGEGDFLPGLVIDRYDDFLVLQISTAGMENLKPAIIQACIAIFNPKGILLKNDLPFREIEGLSQTVETVYGEFPHEIQLQENNVNFVTPIIHGQKTGWFYDHRLNRQRLLHYVKGKCVLDLFSYTGGWGIQAACAGAKKVICVDDSQLAIDYVKENAKLNHVEHIVDTIKGNAFDVLTQFIAENKKFDIVILDPPAFIKRLKDKNMGANAYLRLNQLGLKLMNQNSLLASSSCSMHLSRDELLNTIRKAALNTHKEIKIIEQFHQGPDHPIHPAIKETEYLKGFLCVAHILFGDKKATLS